MPPVYHVITRHLGLWVPVSLLDSIIFFTYFERVTFAQHVEYLQTH